MAASPSPYIGRVQRTAQAGGFTLGHWFVDSYGAEVEPHGHATAHVMCAIAGRYVSDAKGEARTGAQLIYNPAGVWHADRFESGGSFFSATLPRDLPGRLPAAPTRLDAPGARTLVLRLLRELARWDAGSAMTGEALCYELMAHAAGRADVQRLRPAWLDRACETIRDGAAGGLKLGDVARQAGVHPYHLARTFRAFEGCTPGDYLQAVRLERAAGLLARSRLPLAEVAVASGFADQSHLTRRFTAAFGAPPGAYRRLVGV